MAACGVQSFSMVDGTRGMQSLLVRGANIMGSRDAGDVMGFINHSNLRCVPPVPRVAWNIFLLREDVWGGGGGVNLVT